MREFLKTPPGIVALTLVLGTLGVVRFVHNGHLVAATTAIWYFTVSALLPLLIIQKVFREPVSEYGWRLPINAKQAAFWTAAVMAVFLPVAAWFSQMESFQQYYVVRDLSLENFVYIGVIISVFLYPAEEFLLRSFLFLGLWKKIGWHSFWITAAVATLFHISKPGGEIIFAPFLSVALCFLTLKTRSFVPAAAAHYILALFFNAVIMYVSGAEGVQTIFHF